MGVALIAWGRFLDAGRIWRQAGTPISATLSLGAGSGVTEADVQCSITAPSGRTLITGGRESSGVVGESGWHMLHAAADAGATGLAANELTVSYAGNGSAFR